MIYVLFFVHKACGRDLSSPIRDWTPVLEGKILTTGLPGKSPIWPFTENVDWPPNQNYFIRRGLWLKCTAPDRRHQISVKVFDLEVISLGHEDLSASHLRRWLILWSKAGEGGMLCGCWDQLREMGRKKGVGGGYGRQAQPSSLSQVAVAGDTGHEELWDEADVPVHGGRGPGSHGVPRCLWVQQEWWLGVSSCGNPDWGTSEFLKLSVGKVNWLLDQQMPPSAPSGPEFPSLPKFTSPPPLPTDPSCFLFPPWYIPIQLWCYLTHALISICLLHQNVSLMNAGFLKHCFVHFSIQLVSSGAYHIEGA